MKPVIDYVHGLGLTFGLYTSDGDVTCHGGWSPGSLGHWQQDADTFASWGGEAQARAFAMARASFCCARHSTDLHLRHKMPGITRMLTSGLRQDRLLRQWHGPGRPPQHVDRNEQNRT